MDFAACGVLRLRVFAARAACVAVQAALTAYSLWHGHNTIAVLLLRASLRFAYRLPENDRCPRKKTAVNVFYAARLRRPLSNDVPEHLFFLFFFISELFNIVASPTEQRWAAVYTTTYHLRLGRAYHAFDKTLWLVYYCFGGCFIGQHAHSHHFTPPGTLIPPRTNN